MDGRNVESEGIEVTHASRYALAQWLADALEPEARQALEAHFQACGHCRTLAESARKEAEGFAARRPAFTPSAAGDSIAPAPGALGRARAAERPRFGERWWERWFGGFGWRPAFAALLVLAVAGIWWTTSQRHGGPAGETPGGDLSPKGALPGPDNAKDGAGKAPGEGNAQVTAVFKAYLNGKPAGDTMACAPGDTLQLALVAPAPVHWSLWYSDDGKAAEMYMDGSAANDGPGLGRPEGAALPHSLVLAKGWHNETVYALWSALPFTAAQAQAFLRTPHSDASRASAPSLHIQTFLLNNRSP